MIEIVAKVHFLNASSESDADNLALEQRIGLVKKGSKSVSATAVFLEILHPASICL